MAPGSKLIPVPSKLNAPLKLLQPVNPASLPPSIKFKDGIPLRNLAGSRALPINVFNIQLLPVRRLKGFRLPTELHEEKLRTRVRTRMLDIFFIIKVV
jgi:hypothetical protein